jgi:hypothetical protein
MRAEIALALFLLAGSAAAETLAGSAAAETKGADLAVPPASAERFIILSKAGKHGEDERWTAPDGLKMGRESLLLRGQVFELDSAAHFGQDSMLDRLDVRGFTPNGDAAESFSLADGKASWKSPVDAGSTASGKPAMYVNFSGPIDLTADLIEALVAAPDKSLALLPAGRAQCRGVDDDGDRRRRRAEEGHLLRSGRHLQYAGAGLDR